MDESSAKVIVKNSLKVIGKFTLIHEDGREEEVDGKRSFCRCGLSSAMPFCDNTHRSKLKWVKKETDWKDDLRELKYERHGPGPDEER